MTYAELKRRARHPERDPGSWAETCIAATSCYGQQFQRGTPAVVSPFGRLPYREAGGLYGGFTGPLTGYFGVEPGPGARPRVRQRYEEMMQTIQGSQSPLAQYIQQAGAFLPQVFGQAQQAGQQVASMAPGLFDMLRQQIAQAQGQLPGLQQQAAGLSGRAGQAVEQAFSPIASQSLFQNALRGSLESARGAAAGRGLLDAGAAQGQEEAMTRDLAAQFAQQQAAQQQAALGGAEQAQAQQAGLLQMGPAFAQMAGQALPGLQQALMAGYTTPMDALSQVFQQFAAYQNPQLALLGLTAPQVAQRTRGGGFNIL